MGLRDYCNILIFLIGTLSFTFSQVTEVRCINPNFDQLVDEYLNYSVPAISVADAYESKEKFIFLDAREIEEYDISHLQNAIHIGYDKFQVESLTKKVPKNAEIIVYCSIGYRSEKIGEVLKKHGYQSVRNLYGSIFEWVNQHHPIYDDEGKQTNKLHTYSRKWSKWIEDEDMQKIW